MLSTLLSTTCIQAMFSTSGSMSTRYRNTTTTSAEPWIRRCTSSYDAESVQCQHTCLSPMGFPLNIASKYVNRELYLPIKVPIFSVSTFERSPWNTAVLKLLLKPSRESCPEPTLAIPSFLTVEEDTEISTTSNSEYLVTTTVSLGASKYSTGATIDLRPSQNMIVLCQYELSTMVVTFSNIAEKDAVHASKLCQVDVPYFTATSAPEIVHEAARFGG